MPEAVTKVKKALNLWGEARTKMDEAEKVLSHGPSSYYYKKIDNYVETLFERFAPFKEGDRVRIIKVPDTNNAWSRHRHFLILGGEGVCEEVDLQDGKFFAYVMWDNETWIDERDGNKEKPVSHKHVFKMWESQIEKIDDEELQNDIFT